MLGLKDDQSLTVDLHRGQLAHQTLELKFRNALAGCPWTLRSLFPRRKTAPYCLSVTGGLTLLTYFRIFVHNCLCPNNMMGNSSESIVNTLFFVFGEIGENCCKSRTDCTTVQFLKTERSCVMFTNFITAEAIKIISISTSNSKCKHRIIVHDLSHRGCRHHQKICQGAGSCRGCVLHLRP